MAQLLKLGAALLVSLLVLGGCATSTLGPLPKLPSEADRARFGRVAVVATSVQTKAGEVPVRDKGQVASELFAEGAAGVSEQILVNAGPACLGGDPMLAGVCAVAVGVMAVGGAVVGAVTAAVGAADAEPMATAERNAAAIADVLAKVQLQELLRTQVFAYASQQLPQAPVEITDAVLAGQGAPRGIEQIAALGADSMLEIGQVKLRLVASAVGSPELVMYLAAKVRLLRVTDKTVLSEQSFGGFVGTPRKPGEWAANGGMPFRQALESGIRTLAEWVIDELFLLQEIPAPPPVYPALNRCSLCGLVDSTISRLAFSQADSVQPMLRWEAHLPRGASQPVATLEPRRNVGVSYDVRVYRAESPETPPKLSRPSGLVYERKGIMQTSHKIEEPLEPCGKYFWTYRARIQADGQTSVSEWAGEPPSEWARPIWSPEPGLRQRRHMPEPVHQSSWVDAAEDRFPSSYYYFPFVTPCKLTGSPISRPASSE